MNEHRTFFASQPRLVLLPGLVIVITVLGFNLLGDAFRDALDPRHVGAGEASERLGTRSEVGATSEA